MPAVAGGGSGSFIVICGQPWLGVVTTSAVAAVCLGGGDSGGISASAQPAGRDVRARPVGLDRAQEQAEDPKLFRNPKLTVSIVRSLVPIDT